MRRAAAVLIALLVTAVFVPAARAHDDDVSTVAGHDATDDVTLTPAQEQALNRNTIAVSARHVRAAEVAGNPHDVGEWGPVVDWPVVGVHEALLPNGKVLAYDSVGDAAA